MLRKLQIPILFASILYAAANNFAYAQAPPGEFCDDYAIGAVSQQQQNNQLGCGLVGPRWSANDEGHLEWCLAVTETMSRAESAARQSALANCRGARRAPGVTAPPNAADQAAPRRNEPSLNGSRDLNSAAPLPGFELSLEIKTHQLLEACAQGPGQCVWLVPGMKFGVRENNIFDMRFPPFFKSKLGKFRTANTHAYFSWVASEIDLVFPGIVSGHTYWCLLYGQAGDQSKGNEEIIRFETGDLGASHSNNRNLFNRQTSCGFGDYDQNKDESTHNRRKLPDHWALVVGTAPFLADSYATAHEFTQYYKLNDRTVVPKDPFYATARRSLASYPIDCRQPGYEGICQTAVNYLEQHLKTQD